MTQIHGGWLSTSGRSRYDRFARADILAIPSRMLSRPPPAGGDAPQPREVLRFAHAGRDGPPASGQPQRVQLPAGLQGSVLTGRAQPGSSATPVPTHDLDEDRRGSGVLLPEGYTTVERTAVNPRSEGHSRVWKEYFSPDGERFQSRAAAWRHYLRPTAPLPSPSAGGSVADGEVADVLAAGAADTPASGRGSLSSFIADLRSRGPSASPTGSSAPASVAQRSRRHCVPASDVAAQRLDQTVRAGGKGSRLLNELRM